MWTENTFFHCIPVPQLTMVVTNVVNPSTHMYVPLCWTVLLETGLTDPGQLSGRFLGFITVMLQTSKTFDGSLILKC
jgi:hypothetical protein